MAQTAPYWEHTFLHAARLPVGFANVSFLDDWVAYRSGYARWNPIDLSTPVPGSSRAGRLPNGKYARNYPTQVDAADAFTIQLGAGGYVHLEAAFASGNPYTYGDLHGVADDLVAWGSPRFAPVFLGKASSAGSAAIAASAAGTPATKNVAAAWSHLMRTLAVEGHRTFVELAAATASMRRIQRRLGGQ